MSGLLGVRPPPGLSSPSHPRAGQAPTLRGLCPALPAKHHFNSADKSPSRSHHPQPSGRDGGWWWWGDLLQNPSQKAAGRRAGTSAPGRQHSQGALCQLGQVPPSPPDKGGLFAPHEGGMDFGGSQLLPARPQERRVKKPKDKPQAVPGWWPPPRPRSGVPLAIAAPGVRAVTVIWGGSRRGASPSATGLCVGQKGGTWRL